MSATDQDDKIWFRVFCCRVLKYNECQSFNSPDHLACIIKPGYIMKSVVSGVIRIMTAGWPNILWQHIILQLNLSSHEYRNIFWSQLKVLLVCLTIQIKRGMLWDLRDLWCGFPACASFNSRVTSAIPVFTTTTPEQTQTRCSTGF